MGYRQLKKNFVAGLLILLPLLLVLVIHGFNGLKITDFKPAWGDEQWWWAQADAVSEFGKPLGYWGYNGGRAAVGTFATWGPAMVLPYGLFGWLFGWNYSSYMFANVIFLSIATLIFILLTKVDLKGVVLLCICNLLLVVKNYYILTAMAECTRYALCIIGVGAIWYLYNHPKSHWGFKFIFLPIFLVYSTQAYLLFSIFFLFYMLCILQKVKPMYDIGISIAAFGIFAFGSRAVLRLFSSPYVNVEHASLFVKIGENIENMKNAVLEEKGFYSWYLIMYMAFCIFLIGWICMKRTLIKQDRILCMLALLVLMAFLGGHIVLYNTTKWTLIRGLTIGVLIATFAVALLKNKIPAYALIFCIAVQNVSFFYNDEQSIFLTDRFQATAWEDSISEKKAILEQVLILDQNTNNPWENTVATYNAGDLDIALAIPTGFAVNSMMDGTINKNAGYAVVGKNDDISFSDEKVDQMESEGFHVAFEDEKMVVLVNDNI